MQVLTFFFSFRMKLQIWDTAGQERFRRVFLNENQRRHGIMNHPQSYQRTYLCPDHFFTIDDIFTVDGLSLHTTTVTRAPWSSSTMWTTPPHSLPSTNGFRFTHFQHIEWMERGGDQSLPTSEKREKDWKTKMLEEKLNVWLLTISLLENLNCLSYLDKVFFSHSVRLVCLTSQHSHNLHQHP